MNPTSKDFLATNDALSLVSAKTGDLPTRAQRIQVLPRALLLGAWLIGSTSASATESRTLD